MADVTKIGDIINPQVMGDAVEAKVTALCKLTPYATVDTTLQGVPGDTKTIPAWKYVGDAEEFDPEQGTEMQTKKLTATSAQFKVKCAGKSISIYQTAVNSGLGDPIGQAEKQLVKSLAGKIDSDIYDEAIKATTVYDGSKAIIGYNAIVEAVGKFEDEEETDKVIFIHPNQETQLLKDPNFLSADKFTAGVAVNGSIGKIAGCWVKKSKRVKKSGTFYQCPIIKLTNTQEGDSLPALTILLKKDTQLDHEWLPKAQRHDITAAKYYGVALTNDSKVVMAKFKATEG